MRVYLTVLFPCILGVLVFCLFCKNWSLPKLNQARQVVWLSTPKWLSRDTLSLSFSILDTSQVYGILFIMHYANNYPYKNLWLNTWIGSGGSGEVFRINLDLADNNRGYLGSGMGNVYENYSLWKTFRPKYAGIYNFRINHLMESDSLQGIYAVGLEVLPLGRR